MMLRGERVAGGALDNRLLIGARSRIEDIVTEVAVGSPGLARLGLIALALTLQTVVFLSPGHFRPVPIPALSVLIGLATLGALALTLVAGLRLRSLVPVPGRRLLALCALAALGVLGAMGCWYSFTGVRAVTEGATYNNDGAVMDLYAARQVLAGHNPYRKTSIVQALADMNAPSTTTTPLMDGQFRGAKAYPLPAAVDRVFQNVLHYRPRTVPPEFESKYNYPAASFLFILPFVWAGMQDMRFLDIVVVLALGAYLWRQMPRALKPLVPLLVLANLPLVVLTTGGQPDPLYALFLMLAFAEWPRRRLSPAAMGLSIAIKQQAWFFAPLYLILVARQCGLREAARRAAIMVAVFGAINLPFIVQAPSSYLASVTAPMADPMFPMGVGLISMFVANLLPMLPKLAFTTMEIGAWIACLFAALRLRILASPAAMMVLGALPLFFAWRSLISYFYLVPLIALGVMLAEDNRSAVARAAT